MSPKYDAILLISFGGPEGPDDVLPFLENVTRGRGIPRQRLLEVGRHYEQFGGVSPINAQNRALIAALREELDRHGIGLPIYWGNRNWQPMLEDTLRQMQADNVGRSLAFVTSAYSSYSGCRQYREDIEGARKSLGPGAPIVDKLRVYFNHPGFIAANAGRVRSALEEIPARRRDSTAVLFTAHSIPSAMAALCRYQEQLREASRLVSEAIGHQDWRLVFQSRSGPPSRPWLEPDICDALTEERQRGRSTVVVAPIGFVSDHMEIVYDLDTEARAHCRAIGLEMNRAGCAGTHPQFVSMIRELIQERIEDAKPRAVGRFELSPDQCSASCCLYPGKRTRHRTEVETMPSQAG